MKELFYIGILLFSILFVLKALLVLIFWHGNQVKRLIPLDYEKDFSIIQPILSGDISLEKNLTENLSNLQYAQFIWLIDKNDTEAHKITDNILTKNTENLERLKIIEIDTIPAGVNPKVYKMNYAVPFLKKYTIVLDDDTVIESRKLRQAYITLEEKECLITGIPFYQSAGGILSDLVSAFVNSNSLFTYLPMALLEKPKTINGMFYITQTAVLKRLDAFKNIENKLCDDYEIAKLYKANNIPLIQSTIPCRVTTEIKDFSHYQRLMKRWMVFTNKFIKQHLSFNTLFLLTFPSLLLIALLITAIFSGIKYVLLLLVLHFIKASIFRLIRKSLLRNREAFFAILYEIIADYLQIIHYFHALLSPNQIQWRNSTVIINEDKIRFE